jgi:hypothetical protein
VASLEVDEQQTHVRMHQDVSGREVHAVSVVVREHDRVLVQHADEARLAALVRTGRSPLGVGRREEEHVAILDELTIALTNGVADQLPVDSVSQRPRVEAILQRAATYVEPGRHGPS